MFKTDPRKAGGFGVVVQNAPQTTRAVVAQEHCPQCRPSHGYRNVSGSHGASG